MSLGASDDTKVRGFELEDKSLRARRESRGRGSTGPPALGRAPSPPGWAVVTPRPLGIGEGAGDVPSGPPVNGPSLPSVISAGISSFALVVELLCMRTFLMTGFELFAIRIPPPEFAAEFPDTVECSMIGFELFPHQMPPPLLLVDVLLLR